MDYAITVVPFHPLYPPPPSAPCPTHIPPPYFLPMGPTYKFFAFSISYTILTLPLSICYLPFVLLILYLFPHSPPSHSLLITLHVISISVNLFLF